MQFAQNLWPMDYRVMKHGGVKGSEDFQRPIFMILLHKYHANRINTWAFFLFSGSRKRGVEFKGVAFMVVLAALTVLAVLESTPYPPFACPTKYSTQ